MKTLVKICGLSTPQSIAAAAEHGAAMVGFVFFPKSPRAVTADEAASLCRHVPPGIKKVGLVVNASDDEISAILRVAPLDILQLHGNETPSRTITVRQQFELPVMKALAIETEDDFAGVRDYEKVADRLLFDAKPPKGADRPGGNAQVFDWKLLQGREWKCPWMLAGGITPLNVADALKISGAEGIDASSGVESSPGVKDLARIKAFLAAIP